jgi:hypothetical protein
MLTFRCDIRKLTYPQPRIVQKLTGQKKCRIGDAVSSICSEIFPIRESHGLELLPGLGSDAFQLPEISPSPKISPTRQLLTRFTHSLFQLSIHVWARRPARSCSPQSRPGLGQVWMVARSSRTLRAHITSFVS